MNDWQRLVKTGRYDMVRLKEVMLLLIANNEPLGAEWKDHELKGNWAGFEEVTCGWRFFINLQNSNHHKI
ncbi:MAG: type II toxin-antitoxin system mRNA interferase toxin, RelE/StbE family [Moraxella osloensis]